MYRIFINKWVSEENLKHIRRCFSSVNGNAEVSAAIRLARMSNLDERSSAEDVREAVKHCIEEQVKSLNYHYNQKSTSGDNVLITLSLFMPAIQAYELVEGVSGEKQLDVEFEEDVTTGRLLVTCKLVPRVW